MWPFSRKSGATHEGKPISHWVSKLSKVRTEPEAKKIESVFARVLAKADPVETTNKLVEMLVNANNPTMARRHAALALGNAIQYGHIDPEKSQLVVEAVHQMLKEDQPEINEAVLHAVAEMGKTGATLLASLQAGLKRSKHDGELGMLCKCVGVLGPAAKSAVPLVAEVLKTHKNWEVRAFAAEALGLIGRAAGPSIQVLRDALQDESGDVQQNAQEAIDRIRAAKE